MSTKHPVKQYNTPQCPVCKGAMMAHINSGELIGWECLTCRKAIMIERAAYKVR